MPIDGSPSPASTVTHQLSNTLGNRTYVGLLIAQFLAAFNDQAIHASAMFFAINTQTLTEASAISLMPILFYAPWALFCTLAGYFADRYSKRFALVFWKVAEIAICGLALTGFWLGTHDHPQIGAWIVLSTVFLMGTHSAFFVPAKYGVMPEILQAHLLSKGNGLLESLSFLAVILGTVSGGVLSFLFLRQEWMIGIILVIIAVIGAVGSLLIHKMPAANPSLRFPPYLYQPLFRSIKTLLSTKALIFAVIGIAFFTFVVAFMRATVYMLGESQNPRWNELKTSVIVGTVALGIGLGSPLAGWLSGRKVELGLIPIGAFGMIFGCVMAAFTLNYVPVLIAFIVLIGFSTGFYLVPLFTLLQHRAPKTGKGDMIATSNFINVTGAIAASALFFCLVFLAKKVEFVEQVQQADNVMNGRLTMLELEHGRPVYFEVEEEGAPLPRRGGRKPDPDEPQPGVLQQIFGDPHGKPGEKASIVHIDRGIDRGESVIVSRYEIHGVEHLAIRRQGDELKTAYDARRLPQFLFLGAGLMTTITIGILVWRLPDLVARSKRLLKDLRGQHVFFEGIHHIPAHGPTILVTTSADPAAHAAIWSATDRHAVFFPSAPASLEPAARMLGKGKIVGLVLDKSGEDILANLSARGYADAIPVFVARESGLLIVGFGERMASALSAAEMRLRIAASRFAGGAH
jgi:MFS family permease